MNTENIRYAIKLRFKNKKQGGYSYIQFHDEGYCRDYDHYEDIDWASIAQFTGKFDKFGNELYKKVDHGD